MNFTGTGTTVLANSNSYGGNTTLTAGTLVVANNPNDSVNGSSSATGSGTVTLNGGVLASASAVQLSELANPIVPGDQAEPWMALAAAPNAGNGLISGIVKAGTGASTVAPGGIGAVGTLTVGGLAANSNMAFDFDLGSPELGGDNGDLIIISGGGSFTASAGTPIEFSTGPTAAGDYELFELENGDRPGPFQLRAAFRARIHGFAQHKRAERLHRPGGCRRPDGGLLG
jgi:autotransporter-associated beta strand protein